MGRRPREPQSALGARLRGLREKHGLTQGQVAAFAGVTRSWLSRIERGVLDEPGGTKLQKLADYFDVPLAELLHGPSGPQDARSRLLREISRYPTTFLEQMRSLYEAAHSREAEAVRELEEGGGEQSSSD